LTGRDAIRDDHVRPSIMVEVRHDEFAERTARREVADRPERSIAVAEQYSR
jgi:hypothetical protein